MTPSDEEAAAIFRQFAAMVRERARDAEILERDALLRILTAVRESRPSVRFRNE